MGSHGTGAAASVGGGELELPVRALPGSEPPALLSCSLSVAPVEQPLLWQLLLALGSAVLPVTLAPQVLSSSEPAGERTAKPQPRVAALGSCWCLAKGTGWDREACQQLRLSPLMSLPWTALAKSVLLRAGRMKEILGQLVLSSLAKDVDQIFFSNLSKSEMSFLMASAFFPVS